jgi:class 3 adenylate cyclase
MPEAPSEADRERHARLAAAAPGPLIEKMRATRLEGERKPVSAVFVDVVGSTALAETMDPEDWTEIMNQAWELLSQAVFRYEGTIAQLQGDGVLAFFGAPVSHEDDPERAVRAALDMLPSITEYARQLKATHELDFQVRVGINTGSVLVGRVGSDLRYEYNALGDAVNVAARVQAAARPGSILITAETRRYVSAPFELKELPPLMLKGKAEPVTTYEVLGLKAAPGQARGLAGIESPMVGRDGELKRLEDLLPVIAAGRSRVASLVGDPGIGKTRLLAEFKAAAMTSADHFEWIEGRCLSYGRNLPYHLVLSMVRSCLRISNLASDEQTRAGLRSRLQELLGEAWPDAYAYLGHLLSLELEDDAVARLEGLDARNALNRYIGSIHQLLQAISAKHPVVLVWEDVHWADTASVEALHQLMPLAGQLPLLLAITSRPERDAPGWRLITGAREMFGEALTEIALSPLSEEESRELVRNLLRIEQLPTRIRDVMLAKAEGNPFFVEEVIRMLIDQGVLVHEDGARWVATREVETVTIPDTLHGLLLARIDKLPQDARQSLRVASVIGRQFSARVLEQVLEGRSVP